MEPPPPRRLRSILLIALFVITVAGATVYLLWRDHQSMLRRALLKFPAALAELPTPAGHEVPLERFRRACAVLAREMNVPVETLASELPALALMTLDEENPPADPDEGLSAELIIVYLAPAPDHPNALKLRENLTVPMARSSLNGLAEAEMRDVIARRSSVQGPDHDDTLRARAWLVKILFIGHRYAPAEVEARSVLAARERLKSPDDPDTLSARSSLADVLHAAERYAEEEPLRRSLLTTWERLHKTDGWEILHSLYNLAKCLHFQAKDAEALPPLKQALELTLKKYDPDFTQKCKQLMADIKAPP